ncbi:MAG: hypothetical protein ACLUOL_06880, partial [Faecalibacterium sp.]
TAKKRLCKERSDKFSLVFPAVKKLSKILCSFDTVFLFKYDFSENLFIINILLKALPLGELARSA